MISAESMDASQARRPGAGQDVAHPRADGAERRGLVALAFQEIALHVDDQQGGAGRMELEAPARAAGNGNHRKRVGAHRCHP